MRFTVITHKCNEIIVNVVNTIEQNIRITKRLVLRKEYGVDNVLIYDSITEMVVGLCQN